MSPHMPVFVSNTQRDHQILTPCSDNVGCQIWFPLRAITSMNPYKCRIMSVNPHKCFFSGSPRFCDLLLCLWKSGEHHPARRHRLRNAGWTMFSSWSHQWPHPSCVMWKTSLPVIRKRRRLLERRVKAAKLWDLCRERRRSISTWSHPSVHLANGRFISLNKDNLTSLVHRREEGGTHASPLPVKSVKMTLHACVCECVSVRV